MITTCYSLGLGFFALEALNLYEVSRLKQRNSWVGTVEETGFKMPKMALRIFLTIVVLGGVVTTATSSHFTQVATSWTCLGNFVKETIDLWLPVVLINACAAVAATLFSYYGWFILRKVPQFRQKMSIYLEERDLSEKYNIEKCYRNVVFTAFGPWLLCGVWLTLALSTDRVAEPALNNLAKVFSMLYTMCNALQSVLTTTSLYSTCTWYAMRFLPCKYSPAYDPVTLWKRSEVLERYRLRKNGTWKLRTMTVSQGPARNYPWTAAHPDYVPILVRGRLQTRWMRKYAEIRTGNDCSKFEALYVVYLLEFDKERAHMCSKGVNDQISFLFCQWFIRTYIMDPQKDIAKAKAGATETELLHSKFYELWDSLKILQPPGPPNSVDLREYFTALVSYLKLFEYDPFESCPLSTTDCYGNTQRVVFLRTPVRRLNPALFKGNHSDQNSEEDQKKGMKQRGKEEGRFDQWWMLTRKQKRIVKLHQILDLIATLIPTMYSKSHSKE
ncbi:hypothetical protein Y032_0079g1269 [Ancylostoma ceylanicum]|uniref:Uncharacterized protein n=1 Tax=Ancylostoma ceylanicum TaxID=53326 RepID=A0A016TU62_9BILA|nr:hypothetical protein Y032_0079g1269 [Ancylostoma ceylanicum]